MGKTRVSRRPVTNGATASPSSPHRRQSARGSERGPASRWKPTTVCADGDRVWPTRSNGAPGLCPRSRCGATKEPAVMPERSARAQPEPIRAGGAPVTIVLLVTEDWYFWSHRLPIARAARAAGARVVVATRVGSLRRAIEAEGFVLAALPWRRRSSNPFNELRALIAIVRLYRRERPDLVHHVAIKPVVYGGIAARLARARAQVNAIAGFGYVEVSRHAKARVLRRVFRAVLRFAWSGNGVHAIVQNDDDRDALAHTGLLTPAHVHVIRGSGVDVMRFTPSPEPSSDRVRAVYAGRLLWSKGIRELV